MRVTKAAFRNSPRWLCAGAVGLGFIALSPLPAHATITDTINLGALPSAAHLNLTGSYTATSLLTAELASTVSGYAGKTSITGSNTANGFSPGGLTYDYNFSFGSQWIASATKGPLFSMMFTPTGGAKGFIAKLLSGYNLIDDTTGQVWHAKYAAGGTSLDLVACIPKADMKDKFTIQVVIPGILGGSKGGFQATGDVPIPGALIMFGSALVGLGVYGARRRGVKARN
jgi:hypothetical protein